ncbi:MAG: hypothetical protein ACREMX_02045, partial [Gemmatimonadales bacterium]
PRAGPSGVSARYAATAAEQSRPFDELFSNLLVQELEQFQFQLGAIGDGWLSQPVTERGHGLGSCLAKSCWWLNVAPA